MKTLHHLHIESGVSAFTGEGFCRVEARDEAGQMLGVGQMTPSAVREMVMGWLTAAGAAESDAAVWAALKGIKLDDQAAGAFLSTLREQREKRA